MDILLFIFICHLDLASNLLNLSSLKVQQDACKCMLLCCGWYTFKKQLFAPLLGSQLRCWLPFWFCGWALLIPSPSFYHGSRGPAAKEHAASPTSSHHPSVPLRGIPLYSSKFSLNFLYHFQVPLQKYAVCSVSHHASLFYSQFSSCFFFFPNNPPLCWHICIIREPLIFV